MTTINVTNKLHTPITIGTTAIPGDQSSIVTGVSLNQLMALRQSGIIDFTTDGPIDSYGGPFNRTYSLAVVLTPAATASDILTITGSSSATINITRIYVTGDQTTTGLVDLRLERRSTANTGGTATNPTPVQHDTSDPAATAVVAVYTANPTVGTVVGAFRRALFPLTGLTAVSSAPAPWVFGDAAKAIVLRGASQSVAVSMNGSTTLVAGQIFITVEWFEA